MRVLSRTGLYAALFATMALAPACGSEDEPVGLQLVIYGPADDTGAIDPDFDPFDECDFVRVCYTPEGETTASSCSEVSYLEKEAALKSIPFGEKLTITVECRQAATDAATGSQIHETKARGSTCGIRHEKGKSKEYHGIYMLPTSAFGPTYDPDGKRQTEPGNDARWGATVTEVYDGTLLVAGGAQLKADCDWASPKCVSQPTASAEVYDPATGVFTPLPASNQLMTEKRAFAAAVQLPSEEIAVFGGINGSGEPTDSIDLYNPIDQTFSPATKIGAGGAAVASKMNKSRSFHTATLILSQDGGYVLLVGGYGVGEGYWELWNPKKGTVLEGKLGTARHNHTATLITKEDDPLLTAVSGLVVVAGGEVIEGNNVGVRDTIELFDVAAIIQQKTAFQTEQYSLCTNDPADVKAAPKTMLGAALVPARHFLYLAGGFSDVNHASPTRDICVFNYLQRSWASQTGGFKLGKARGGLTATSMPNNQILFAGGLTLANSALTAAETVEVLFEFRNAEGDLQIAIGPDDTYPIGMLSPRWNHTATMGCDGKVLFVGGLAGSVINAAPDQTSELFNPQ